MEIGLGFYIIYYEIMTTQLMILIKLTALPKTQSQVSFSFHALTPIPSSSPILMSRNQLIAHRLLALITTRLARPSPNSVCGVNSSLHNQVRAPILPTTRHRHTTSRKASRPLCRRKRIIKPTRITRRNRRASNINHDLSQRVPTRSGIVNINLAILVHLRGPRANVDSFALIVAACADVQGPGKTFGDLRGCEGLVPAPALAGGRATGHGLEGLGTGGAVAKGCAESAVLRG